MADRTTRIRGNQILDGTITSDELASSAVIEAKIADGAVTIGKLAQTVVNSDKGLSYNAVTGIEILVENLAFNPSTGALKIADSQIVNAMVSNAAAIVESKLDLDYSTSGLNTAIGNHTADTNNPHSVTKTQVGLGNVTNDAQVKASEKGAANGVAELDANGVIPTSQMPSLSIIDTYVVASEVAMLALTAQKGDIAIRSDLSKTFILATSDPTQLANWKEMLAPGAVISVNGQTGAVSLDPDDLDDAATTHKFVTSGDLTNLSNLSGTNTGDQDLSGLAALNKFVFGEVANETPDSIVVDFTHDNAAYSGSVQVFLNGMLQQVGVGKDYTYDSGTKKATFAVAPDAGDIVLFNYIKS